MDSDQHTRSATIYAAHEQTQSAAHFVLHRVHCVLCRWAPYMYCVLCFVQGVWSPLCSAWSAHAAHSTQCSVCRAVGRAVCVQCSCSVRAVWCMQHTVCRAVGRHKNVRVSYRLACPPPPDAPGQEDDDIYWDGEQQISNYLAQSQFWPHEISATYCNFEVSIKLNSGIWYPISAKSWPIYWVFF